MTNTYRITESGRIIDIDRIWRYGRPAPIWIYHADMIGKFVSRNRLRPIPNENLPFVMDDPAPAISPSRATAKSRAVKIKPRPFPGGLRFPHLHCKERIYALNEKQWKSFSQILIKDFQAKLNRAETISFQHVIELSDVITGM